MGRCTNKSYIDKVGFNILDKETTIDFNVLTDIENCAHINTNRQYAVSANTVASWNAYAIPKDVFNCDGVGCRNTGTLTLTRSTGTAALSASYQLTYDATEFYGGVATYYVHLPEPGSYSIATTISDIRSQFTAADTYTKTIVAEAAGDFPIVVDLSKAPSTVVGGGWIASTAGINIRIAITPPTDVESVGISSIYFYDDITDFEVNDVVKLGCVEEIAGDLTIDPVDASCWGSGYDSQSISVERTITARKVTPNWWKLNPLMTRGEAIEGWDIVEDERPVCSVTIDGTTYGYIQVPDLQTDECGFLTVAVSDQCNVTDSALNRVSSPTLIDLSGDQYIVYDGTTTEALDAGTILFNERLIGLNVVVSYPKKVFVEEYIGVEQTLYERRVRMSFSITQTDGVKIRYIYNNVLITVFPWTYNTEETSLDFTISIQRDKEGRFFQMYRIEK